MEHGKILPVRMYVRSKQWTNEMRAKNIGQFGRLPFFTGSELKRQANR